VDALSGLGTPATDILSGEVLRELWLMMQAVPRKCGDPPILWSNRLVQRDPIVHLLDDADAHDGDTGRRQVRADVGEHAFQVGLGDVLEHLPCGDDVELKW
jgi:hypothetical protein